jgi:hypothetical protein
MYEREKGFLLTARQMNIFALWQYVLKSYTPPTGQLKSAISRQFVEYLNSLPCWQEKTECTEQMNQP